MTEADEATPAREPAPAPAAAEASAPEPSRINAEGRERPQFLLEFPEDPELARLVRAFEQGDYQAVRLGAPRLVAASEDPIVRAAARELRRRIDPDPLVKYLLGVALLLFVFVVWYTYQGQTR